MVHLLLGRSGSGKSQALLEEMAAQAPHRRQILIVPEQISHLAERRLFAVGGSALALGGEVLTFTRLASRVFSVAGGLAKPTLDGGGRALVMYLAATQMAQGLTVYAKPSRKPAFLVGLLDTLDECKSYQVPFQALYATGETLGGVTGDKLKDLALIFNAYDTLCQTLGADPRDKLTRLAKALEDSRWGDGMDFYLDGFTDFTPQQGLVLAALMAQGHSVHVALTCDHLEEDEGGLGIFSPARRTAAFVARLAQEAGQKVTVSLRNDPLPGKAPALVHLEQNLFADAPQPWEGKTTVTRAVAQDPRQEVEWVAAQVLYLVREKGLRFRDIAVTSRAFEGYEELVNSIFPRYGIPVFLARSEDILEKPVLALIIGALEAISSGYRFEEMFRYLKTGLAGLTDEERDRLENYVLLWDVRGGKWIPSAPWHMHPKGFGNAWSEEDEKAVAALDAIRQKVIAPLESLRKREGKTGRDRAEALYQFLEDISLPTTLEARAKALRERGELGLAEEYHQLWDILVSALESCARLLEKVEMSLDDFSKLFALTLSQYQVSAIPVALDRLTAGPCPRLGYQSFQAVFLLGCDDRQMPLCAASPGLFTDDDREALRLKGFTLAPKMEDRLRREMTIVYNVCTLPTRYLFVSYSKTVEEEERRASFLIPRLEKIFPKIRKVEVEQGPDPRLAAPEPAMELAARTLVGESLRSLEGYGERLDRMEAALALERGRLSPPHVEEIFGKKVRMSASQLDLCRSCHFSHFMRYGLRARPRQRADFNAVEYGNFVHSVLEKVARQWTEERGRGASPDWRGMTQEAIREYLDNELGGLEDKTPRFQFLFRRLEDTVVRVVENVITELEASDFTPVAFELGFGAGKELPPVELTNHGVTVSLSGFIDRVDGWAHDGKLYLRVVDYKTGKKPFDLGDILHGIGLQMLLYLSTLEKERAAYFGQTVIPAGVLYIPAREAVAVGSRDMDEKARQAQMDKLLTRQGLVRREREILEAMEHIEAGKPRFLPLQVNKDGEFSGDALASAEELGKLSRHVEGILGEVGRELAEGTVDADPYWRGPDHNACQWCPYSSACQFEEGRGGEARRWGRRVTAQEFWEKL